MNFFSSNWIKDTFNLVDAADAGSGEDQKQKEIQAKLASYEAELRAEAASDKSGVTHDGSEYTADEA